MPRNSSGVYSLPAGNPVTPFTVITSAWANPTLADVAAEITNSLSRDGYGGMRAPFRIFDGTLAQPGLGFLNEVGIGIYRESAGVAHIVNTSTKVITLRPSIAEFPNTARFLGATTHKVSGFKSWLVQNQAGVLTIAPSTSVDGEDWDYTKATTWDPATGQVSWPAGTGFLPLAGGTLTGALNFVNANFSLGIVSSNARITLDSGDFIEWNRAGNYLTLPGKVGISVTANLTGLLNFPTANSGEVINYYSSATESARSGVGKYASEVRHYIPAAEIYTWYTGGPAGTERMRLTATGLGVGMTPTHALDVMRHANTAGYSDVAWVHVSNNAGATNYTRMGISQISTNVMGIEVADQANVKGTLYLQPFGGPVILGNSSSLVSLCGDFNFSYQLSSGNPVFNFDTGGDGLVYNRASNQLEVWIGGVVQQRFVNTQYRYSGGIVQNALGALNNAGGAWNWATTSTAHGVTPGGAISFEIQNPSSGEIKRLWVRNTNTVAFTLPAGSFSWISGHPSWASSGGTLITLICVDTNYVLGYTSKVA